MPRSLALIEVKEFCLLMFFTQYFKIHKPKKIQQLLRIIWFQFRSLTDVGFNFSSLQMNRKMIREI